MSTYTTLHNKSGVKHDSEQGLGNQSNISDKNHASDGPSMHQIRLQTLRRRNKFKLMQEEEQKLEEKRRIEALQARKQRLQELDPQFHRKRPTLHQLNPAKKLENKSNFDSVSNNIEKKITQLPSVTDSTKLFELAEKLVEMKDVTTSYAVNILDKNSTPSSVISNGIPPRKIENEFKDLRHKLIGQKIKLKQIEVPAEQKSFRSRPSLKNRKPGVSVPRSPSTVISNITTQSEPVGRFYKDTSSNNSAIDNDLDSILSAPSRFKSTKRTQSRPWREKPTIPVRKDFETGYSVEISNIEKSIGNLDKVLEQKKEKFIQVTKEREQWIKMEQEKKQKTKIEQELKERHVQNRIPHEDYGKYLQNFSDSEEEIDDETISPQASYRNQRKINLPESKDKKIISNNVNNENLKPSTREGTRTEFQSKNTIPKTEHIRIGVRRPSKILPSPSNQVNTVDNFSRITNHEQNAMMQLDSASTPSSHQSFRNITPPSTNISTLNRIIPKPILRAQPEIQKEDISLTDVHNNLISKGQKSTGLVLRRFTTNSTSNNSTLVNPSTNKTIQPTQPSIVSNRVYNIQPKLLVQNVISNTPRSIQQPKHKGNISFNSDSFEFGDLDSRKDNSINDTNGGKLSPIQGTEYSFMENSVVIDDDLPELPLMKKYSFRKRIESFNNEPLEGGQINVQDSKALQFLGLA